MGYPPVRGRLHTRYAPVRRSQGSKLPLPLDLHVLGLPLAFILSQDQTLHRRFLNIFRRNILQVPPLRGAQNGLFFSLFPPPKTVAVRCQSQYVNELFPFRPNALPDKSGCKYKTLFPFPQNLFQKKIPLQKKHQ